MASSVIICKPKEIKKLLNCSHTSLPQAINDLIHNFSVFNTAIKMQDANGELYCLQYTSDPEYYIKLRKPFMKEKQNVAS